MIPPQEASARRREIEDKLKQVGLGRRRRGRRCGKGPRLGTLVGREQGPYCDLALFPEKTK